MAYENWECWQVWINTATGKIMQELDMPESQVCDSTISKDGWVYAIHTSAIQQILHVIVPMIYKKRLGGVVAYTRCP